MKVELRARPYDPYAELAAHERALSPGECGACAVFTGIMRSANAGERVDRMHLEHYPGMTERQLEELAAQAAERWPLQDVLLLHRVGEVLPGQTIVLVAVWSAHRQEAFAACRHLLEALKTAATFWKKEYTHHGARWVERNTPCAAPAAASGREPAA